MSVDQGILVQTVVQGGPAAKAGLRSGDVIVAIDDAAIQDMDDLIVYLADNTSVGQRVTLTVLRDGVKRSVRVALGERPAS